MQKATPTGEVARSKKRRVAFEDTKAAEAAKAAKAAKAAEANEADEATAPSPSQEDEGEDEGAQSNGLQPGKELVAEDKEGGGMGNALMMRMHEDNDKFEYSVVEDDFCNVDQVVFVRDGVEIVFDRPDEDSDDWLLWRLLEKGRIAMQRNKTLVSHLGDVAKIVQPYTVYRATVRGSGPCVMPSNVYWRLKPLPDRVRLAIEGKYFLTMDQTVADIHGNKYCPKDEEIGSMCATAGFPHAIAYQREKGRGKARPSIEYIVGACNSVQVTVRLKKRDANTPIGESVSDTEIKNLITSAHTPTQMESWTDLENQVLLYIGLEFSDGDVGEYKPVPATAFEKTPAFNALFAPAESPPYENGFYEFEMRKGVAIVKFKMAKGATTTNLNKDNKGRLFRFVIKTLNPFLCGLSGFTVRSLPFVMKGVLHNDAKSQERFIQSDNGIIPSSTRDVPK